MKTETLNDIRSILLMLAGFLLFPALNCAWVGNYERAAPWAMAFIVVAATVKWLAYELRRRERGEPLGQRVRDGG